MAAAGRLSAFLQTTKECLQPCVRWTTKSLGKIGLSGLLPLVGCMGNALIRTPWLLLGQVALFSFFSVWGMHLFQGVLNRKCVRQPPANISNQQYHSFVYDISNWLYFDNIFPGCGNASGTKSCQEGYVCLALKGAYSDFDSANFDSIRNSVLTILRLAIHESWDGIYQMVLICKGDLYLYFFVITTVLGYYAISLFPAIIAVEFNQYWAKVLKRKPSPVANANVPNPIAITMLSRQNDIPIIEATEIDEQGNIVSTESSSVRSWRSACAACFCEYNCCSCCNTCRRGLAYLVLSPLAELLTVLVLLFNMFVISMDHDEVHSDLYIYFIIAHILILVYFLEMVLKLVAYGPRAYFRNGWNVYEMLLVFLGFADAAIHIGFLVHFMRFLRLGRYWPAVNAVHSVRKQSGRIEISFLLVGILSLVTLAAIGEAAFREDFHSKAHRFPDGEIPRWTFKTYAHAVEIVFRVICGEWIITYWNCTISSGATCLPFFLLVLYFGKFMFINVWSIFWMGSMTTPQDDTTFQGHPSIENLSLFVNSFSNACYWLKTVCLNSLLSRRSESDTGRSEGQRQSGDENGPNSFQCTYQEMNPCLPASCFKIFRCCVTHRSAHIFNLLRQKCRCIVQDDWFEYVVLGLIFFSFIPMALDDVHILHWPHTNNFVVIVDKMISAWFLVEATMRILSWGIPAYFQSSWRTSDFCIILISCFLFFTPSYLSPTTLGFLNKLKAFRILRVLPYLITSESLLLLVNTLLRSVCPLINLLLYYSLTWFIFAGIGVTLFGGTFRWCVGENGKRIGFSYFDSKQDCLEKNLTWITSNSNFDNAPNAIVTLFHIATFNGWVSIMEHAVDSIHSGFMDLDSKIFAYFVFFVYFGSFSAFIMLMSILVDAYNRERNTLAEKRNCFTRGDAIMEKIAQGSEARCFSEEPLISNHPWQRTLRTVVQNPFFDATFSTFIALYLAILSLEHLQQPHWMYNLQTAAKLVFVLVCAGEVACRALAWSVRFHHRLMDVLDALLLFAAVVDMVIGGWISKELIPPLMLRVVRLLHNIGVHRWLRISKVLQKIQLTIKSSFTSILYIFLILCLFLVIYAVIGMALFRNIKHWDAASQDFNFHTFTQSLLLLFQMSTSAGWDVFLDSAIGKCSTEDPAMPNDCSSRSVASLFCISFVFITNIVLYSLMTIVVMETYSEASDVVNSQITPYHVDRFYSVWRRYDVSSSGFIAYQDTIRFMKDLYAPFKLGNIGKYKLAILDVPIRRGDRVHHVDLLKRLAKEAIHRQGLVVTNSDAFLSVLEASDPNAICISTSLWRQREDFCARVIQKAWRKVSLGQETW